MNPDTSPRYFQTIDRFAPGFNTRASANAGFASASGRERSMGACFSSPTGGGGSTDAEVLFFPDAAGMPCRLHLAGKPCGRANCTYAHADTSLVKLLRRIDAASKTLDVCVFTITCNEIADAVVRAHERGVKVRVISDDEQANSTGSDLRAIADTGIPVRTDAASTHMHHKFAIVDGATLINGSFNWTRQAVLGNQENVVIARDAKLAGVFAKEFDSMWGKFRGNEYAGRGGGGNRA